MNTNYVTINKFCAETGYSEDAIRSKITRGDWIRGKEYTKAPDGRILINVDGYHKWVESIQESENQAIPQSKSISITKASAAANVYPLSPAPLT